MRVSARTEYGVRTMVQLARAYGAGPVPLSQVAEKERMPLDFLEQLMVVMRQKGLVHSARGVHGGYFLAMDPSQITVWDVMAAVDGPFVPMQCLDVSVSHQDTCSMGIMLCECTTRDVWALLQEKVMETLNSVTLADLRPEHEPPLRQRETAALTLTLPQGERGQPLRNG